MAGLRYRARQLPNSLLPRGRAWPSLGRAANQSARRRAGLRRARDYFTFGRDRLIGRIQPTVEEIVAHFGTVDILVNNAGIAFRESAEETPEDKWDLTMAVNLKAVFLLSQAVGRHFLEQGHGKIVNIASQAPVAALANHLAYCTSKYGLLV